MSLSASVNFNPVYIFSVNLLLYLRQLLQRNLSLLLLEPDIDEADR